MDVILTNVAVFLIAAVAIVPLAKLLRLGSVLGYLLAGLLIGPWGLRIIPDGEVILHFAEFGVVLLLFLIGLELKPQRLWELRRLVLGAGASQLVASALVLAVFATVFGLGQRSAIVVGLVLALSSTAFALQLLEERKWTDTVPGQTAFSVLLFQDIAVIPLLAIIPILGSQTEPMAVADVWVNIARAGALIAAILLLGPRLARPLFRIIAATGSRELFTALSLLIVIGLALLVHLVGMSMALGAFIGGVLLADSEYRHELEVDLEPFKGLLMGLFFMAVGMSMDVGLCLESPQTIIGLTLIVMTCKFLVLYGLGRFLGLSQHQPWQFAALLCQGGEFGFVVFGAAAAAKVMQESVVDMLTAVIALSMVLTPLVLASVEKLTKWRVGGETPEADVIDGHRRPVIIAGFGRFGQIIGRLLNANGFETTVIERDPDQIEMLRRLGLTVYYGDATRLDLLRAADAGSARLLIVALNDPDATLRLVDLVREHYPRLPLIVRVRNRTQAYEMLDRGIESFERETFEGSLNVGVAALTSLGFDNERAGHAAQMFREYDEGHLLALHPLRSDQKKYLSMVTAAREDFERLMQVEAAEVEALATRREIVL